MITDISAFGALISYVSNSTVTHLQPHQVDIIKEYVEDATKSAPPSGSASCADVDALLEAMRYVDEGKFIEAIKCYRNLTGASLKDSKEAIERYRDK